MYVTISYLQLYVLMLCIIHFYFILIVSDRWMHSVSVESKMQKECVVRLYTMACQGHPQ